VQTVKKKHHKMAIGKGAISQEVVRGGGGGGGAGGGGGER